MGLSISRLLRAVTIIHTCALVAACAPRDNGEQSGTVAQDSAFRVALLTPGPISDQSWNGGAYQGLIIIRDSLGAQVSHIETKTPAQFEENFRQYGAQGYAIVFGHGFEFQDAALRVGPDFPGTRFITTSGNRAAPPNVAALEFAFEEGSYLAGMVAAGVSRTGVVGCIGGTALPPVERSFAAFAAGARAVDPDVRVITSYLGTWDDVSAGKEQALAQIGRRADVIFGNADAAGLGIFQAARGATGILVIGANADQAPVAPDVVIGSVVIDLPRAFASVAREVREGRFTARVIAMGTSSDVIRWTYNPALEATVPAPIRARVDSVRVELAAGRFTLPASP
jgi:basic membrane lipoprotein Med (substrate-binding protein (PBP1-ABC) superfamily)